jgi:uncharacterized protein (DUF1015 family)
MSALGERIEPLRALLYNPAVAGDPARLVAPPYDLIGAERQRELYERSPFNIVRLELGRGADRYGEAAATLRDWLQRGVLVRAAAPAIYLYTQTFELDARTRRRDGFIARIRLEEFARGRILPHEGTFPAAKEDRLKLLTAIRTNTSSIFGLYSGAHPELDRLRGTVAARPALIDLVDDLAIRNQLRAIETPAEIAVIQRALGAPHLLIADGHHRYETALNYRRERRRSENPVAPQSFDYTMMTLVACNDPGLVILPTHRVVRALDPAGLARFCERARQWFDIEEFDTPAAMRARVAAAGRGALGLALRSQPRLLVLLLRDLATLADELPDSPAEVRELDVSILHTLVFDRIFGLRAGDIRKGGNIEYTIDASAALDAVRAGRADGAFLMNPPSIGDVERVSDAGATMPEKSTYFHPKLLTGLVMNPLDNAPAGGGR